MTENNENEDLDRAGQPPANNRRRGGRKILVPVFAVLMVAALAVFYWYHFLRGDVATDDAAIDGDAATSGAQVHPGEIGVGSRHHAQ